MKRLTRKQYWFYFGFCMIWVFVYLGMTAILDDYYELGYLWNLILLSLWIFICYSIYDVYICYKGSKSKKLNYLDNERD